MNKEHLKNLFSAYYMGWDTFEYDDDKELNGREVYKEMMNFILDYCKENGIETPWLA